MVSFSALIDRLTGEHQGTWQAELLLVGARDAHSELTQNLQIFIDSFYAK